MMPDTPVLPLNRVLHPHDYQHPDIATRRIQLQDFRKRLGSCFYRNDHTHRDWEYAEILRKLDLFGLRPMSGDRALRVLDTGSGCSYFPLLLRLQGYDVHVSDSEAYGPVRQRLIEQCLHLGITVPLIIAPLEDHGMIPTGHFDLTLCISVIEHVPREGFALAWRELARVTAPGGYVFVTSDYFRDHDHWLHSEALGCQHNAFMPERMPEIVELAASVGLELVGEADWAYRGDFVNNYSFVTLTFRKGVEKAGRRAEPPAAPATPAKARVTATEVAAVSDAAQKAPERRRGPA